MSGVKQKVALELRVFESLVSTFPDFPCTVTDIKFPKKDFVVGFYLFVLGEMQYYPNKILYGQLEEQLSRESHAEMLRDTFQLINLSKVLRTILNQLQPKSGLQFGLNDLVDPSPARNSSFMFTLLNFFNFADQRVGDLKAKVEVVGERKAELEKLLSKREMLARERNNRAAMKTKKKDFAKEVHQRMAEFSKLKEESASLEKLSDKRQEELEEVKRHLIRLQSKTSELTQTYQKLQAQQVQSPEVLKNTHKHLEEKLKETKLLLEQAKETNKARKKNLQLLEKVAKEQETRLSLLEDIVAQAKEVKKLNSDLANLESKLKSDVTVTELSQVKVNGYKNDISRLAAQLSSLQLQHEKTKSSLKESIRHYQEEKKALEDKESSEVESTLEAINNVQEEINELIDLNNNLNNRYEKLYEQLIQQEEDFLKYRTSAIDAEIAEISETRKSSGKH
ncbi:Laminin subunit gamma-1 [Frankliniella fusca]|uniref:Laminin subunit gamma-1 n=1 Tax=Frankliniella fusca TaxID=407009 RepID=A0AAE1GSJ1_9NEOP|nr:Laminin subunit gamma-1 [Frankliniella fusca]